jgi:hypothetical protein
MMDECSAWIDMKTVSIYSKPRLRPVTKASIKVVEIDIHAHLKRQLVYLSNNTGKDLPCLNRYTQQLLHPNLREVAPEVPTLSQFKLKDTANVAPYRSIVLLLRFLRTLRGNIHDRGHLSLASIPHPLSATEHQGDLLVSGAATPHALEHDAQGQDIFQIAPKLS